VATISKAGSLLARLEEYQQQDMAEPPECWACDPLIKGEVKQDTKHVQ